MKYDNDGSLRELVAAYDDDYGKYFSITCVCIEGGVESISLSAYGVAGYVLSGLRGARANDFGVMTANEDCLRIYVLKKNAFKVCAENMEDVVVLYYDTFTKIEIKKFFLWTSIKIHFMFEHENKPRKIKIVVTDKTLVQRGQKENVKRLTEFLKEFKRRNFL
jgi:hypothetical protein